MKKTVAVYLRVSTDNNKNGHVQSTDMQRLEIKQYLQAKGIEDYWIYEDIGYSGTKKNRPHLKRMMEDCKKGMVSTVICYKLDRLFRSLKDLMDTMFQFNEYGVEFVSVKDSIDMSTPTGRLLFQILGSFAEFEAAVIKERITSGLMNAKSKGVKLGRKKKDGHSVVQELKNQGKSVKEISLHTGLSETSVYNTLARNKEEV